MNQLENVTLTPLFFFNFYIVQLNERTIIMDSHSLDSSLLSLLQIAQTLLIESTCLASEKKIDRRLWMIFKEDIKKRAKRIEEIGVVEEKMEWIDKLLKEMIKVNKLKKKEEKG